MDDGEARVRRRWRLGVVSFLNAKPLIAGLDEAEDVELLYDVPSRLPALLHAGAVDAALIPVIDLGQNTARWQTVSDACIGCDGQTLTVRVFSRVPPEQVRTLHVDGDSHTSVALAAILWKELYRRRLHIVPLKSSLPTADCEAVLLIGDKVVSGRPGGYDVETDLGDAWRLLTSLPFVFAVWAAPRELEAGDLPWRLERARDRGLASVGRIAAKFGPLHGWPVPLAEMYLSARLKFRLGPKEREGMAKFLELARANDLLTPPMQEPVLT